MPYIKAEKRIGIANWEPGTSNLFLQSQFINTPGDLNYAVTELLVDYIKRRGLSYQSINDIVGALTCCKDEFQRRVTNGYEDSKIKENGEVYTWEPVNTSKEASGG